jgi:hypothetical protein
MENTTEFDATQDIWDTSREIQSEEQIDMASRNSSPPY